MDILEDLKRAVFARQKNLSEIYGQHGSKSLYGYANAWPVAAADAGPLFLEMEKLLLQRYPKQTVADVLNQLSQLPLVSTIDHHGLLNHPFFVNSNLIYSQKKSLRYLVCLATSGVSLNNSSWPGCFLITSDDGRERRFSLFADSQKMLPVFSAPAISKKNTQKVLAQISGSKFLNADAKNKLKNLADELFANNDVYHQPNFSVQASELSSRLWQKIFPSAPKLVYLPIEDLVSSAIANLVAADENHSLHKLFFNAAGLDLLEKFFAGTPGAFGRNKGSFLFWQVGKNGRRLPLRQQGMKLVAESLADIELNPQTIAEALEARQIYPTGLVCFLVLLYYGLTCLGGFNQVNWLTEIKQKFLALLGQMGQSGIADKIKTVPTQNFAEGNLAFLQRNGQLIKARGLDLFLTGQDTYRSFQNLAKKISLTESIESLLPEIYRVITPAGERDARLLNISDQEIAAQNGMQKKILESMR